MSINVPAGLGGPDYPAAVPHVPQQRLAWARQAACVLVPIALWFAPLGLAASAQHGLAITVFMVLGWITEVTEYAVTGLVGCFLFWALNVAPVDQAFSGFADSTSWFIFAALLLGTVATNTGIAARLANAVMRRVGASYSSLLFGLVVTSFLLTFIVPSGTSRVTILAAITIGLIEALGLKKGDNAARGMFLVTTYTAALFDKFMISGASAITGRGLMERTGGVTVSWSEWFAAYAPCSILVVIASWWLTLKLFPPERAVMTGGRAYLDRQQAASGRMTTTEKRAAALLLAALLFWMTDFLHHISPAVIGLGVVLVALLPRVDVLRVDDLRRLNILPFIFVAAAISMANVLAATKGLSVVTDTVLSSIEPLMSTPLLATTVLYWAAFVYHFLLASEISMLVSSIPPLMLFAKEHAFNPKFIGMVWTFAAGGKLFAYQNGPLVIGYAFGYFRARDLVILGSAITIVEFIVLVPTVLFYWPLIGIGW